MLAVLANAMGSVVPIFLSLYLHSRLGFGILAIGWVFGFFGLGSVVGSYGSGLLCDKYSPRKISIVSLFINGLVLLAFLLFHSFHRLLMLSFLLGLSGAAFTPANTLILLSSAVDGERTRVNGLRRTVVNIGLGVAIFASGLLVNTSFNAVFIFNGVLTLIATAILLLPMTHLKIKPSTSTEKKIGKNGIWQDKSFLLLAISTLVVFVLFSQLRSTYPLYLSNSFGIDAQFYSYLFLLNTILIVFLEVPLLSALKNCDQHLVFVMGGLAIALSLFILPFWHSYFLVLISCLLWTFGEMLAFSTALTLFYEKATPENKGKYLGAYQLLFSASRMFGPLAGAWVYHFANPEVLWYFGGGLGGVALLLFLFFDRAGWKK